MSDEYPQDGPHVEVIKAHPTVDGCEGVLAIAFRNSANDLRCTNGPMFITPASAPMQAAFMRYHAGTLIDRHSHPVQSRTLLCPTAEVIIVMKGTLYVDLFNSQGDHERTIELRVGDLIILYSGGHAFRVSEDSEIIEVKQGPYQASLDKVRY